jgi:hypothetical protein
LNHSYWIPLTVAWITKPDFAGTTMRVVERVLGTVIGVVASVLLIDLIGSSIPLELAMFAAGSMITVLFIVANYTLCTVGVTIWLMAVLEIGSASTGARVVQTLAAGLLVIGASRLWLAITAALGAAFLAGQMVEYFSLPFSLTDNLFASTFYALTGFHGLHVSLGVICITIVALQTRAGGRISASDHFGLEAAELYWHFVDGIWVVLYGILYLL